VRIEWSQAEQDGYAFLAERVIRGSASAEGGAGGLRCVPAPGTRLPGYAAGDAPATRKAPGYAFPAERVARE
jgi:hypothetical protein